MSSFFHEVSSKFITNKKKHLDISAIVMQKQKKTRTYEVVNPSPRFGQRQTCGGVYPTAIHKNKQAIKHASVFLHLKSTHNLSV